METWREVLDGNPELFLDVERKAKEISEDGGKRHNKVSQVRKFYNEVLKFKTQVRDNEEKFKKILPYLHMLKAKVVYAGARGNVSKKFEEFISEGLSKIKVIRDFNIFASYFEAFIGFYKLYGGQNKGE